MQLLLRRSPPSWASRPRWLPPSGWAPLRRSSLHGSPLGAVALRRLLWEPLPLAMQLPLAGTRSPSFSRHAADSERLTLSLYCHIIFFVCFSSTPPWASQFARATGAHLRSRRRFDSRLAGNQEPPARGAVQEPPRRLLPRRPLEARGGPPGERRVAPLSLSASAGSRRCSALISPAGLLGRVRSAAMFSRHPNNRRPLNSFRGRTLVTRAAPTSSSRSRSTT